MRRKVDTAFGALFLGALAAALPVGMRLARGGRELGVTLRTQAPHEIAPRPRSPLAPVTVGPPSLIPRLERSGEPDDAEPGLSFRTWQVTYGRRWERQVTVPVLTGAFDPEGRPWPCAVALRFSPRFFDDGERGGEDVASVIDRVVRAQFPFDVLGLRFAPVASTSLHVRPTAGGIEVRGGIALADGPRDPTQFTLDAKIALGERDGDLSARIDRLSIGWTGRTRNDPLVALASMFVDVDAEARGIVAEKLRGALGLFKLPREPLPLFPDRPRDRLTLRLCDAPESRADGVTVRLRVVATLADPRLDPAVPGPPHLEARPELAAAGRGRAAPRRGRRERGGRRAGALPDVASGGSSRRGASSRGWRRRRAGQAPGSARLRSRRALSPHLPPVVLPAEGGGAFRVRFGDVVSVGRAGERDEKRVVANEATCARRPAWTAARSWSRGRRSRTCAWTASRGQPGALPHHPVLLRRGAGAARERDDERGPADGPGPARPAAAALAGARDRSGAVGDGGGGRRVAAAACRGAGGGEARAAEGAVSAEATVPAAP